MDAFVGESEGNIHFFENTGTGGEADFEHYYPSDTENPFYGQNVGQYSSPAFVDMDGDGDMDMVAGGLYGYGYGGEDPAPGSEAAVLDAAGWRLNYFENVGTASAPAFVERTGTRSPFTGFDVGYNSTPVFVDIDGDGDLDAFSGEWGLDYSFSDGPPIVEENPINFFENIGTSSAPAFVDKSDQADNPFFGAVSNLYYSFVAFADIDGDGDMDAFVGGQEGENDDVIIIPPFIPPLPPDNMAEKSSSVTSIQYFENTGTKTAPRMSQRIDDDNPLDMVNDSYDKATTMAFVDIDGDGDMDAFVGNHYGYDVRRSVAEAPDIDDDDDDFPNTPIKLYRNIGSAQNPIFTPDDNGNPLGFVSNNVYSMIFVDADGDGDMDVVVGESSYDTALGYNASLQLYENVGSATDPAFAPVPKANDWFEKMTENSPYIHLYPAIADIDGDGDPDIFAGETEGRFLFIENQTPIPEPDDDDDDDDTPILLLPEDDDTCFVDTATTNAGPSFLTRTARSIYDAVTSIFK